MQNEIKDRLEELVGLINDPETTVIEKEIIEKLEIILALAKNPEELENIKKDLKVRRDKVIALVSNASVDPDIEVEYCPSEGPADPYLLVKYIVSEYTQPTRKISLKGTALRRNTPEELANQITFSIEEFKGEIDSVEMG
ncbi:MAG: hypothetical protein GQ531_00205 [Sulfurovum sp.]|nr:hypothetical protein [Sulfurovum sp.]